ncbi:MAG TPA: glycosyltransferase family 4 protein, partial [Tepidiformaceae bacterium]|nr:glycosyltransferase family 4 protein [Tepidiformaceae bacterium]
DLQQWRPNPRSSRDPASPLRLLFVGNNFVRKGGDLLVALMRSPWGQQFELDVVSGEDVRVEATNVRLRRAAPNTPELRALFARADVFVLPTRAECFGIAAVEAMASGLPVIMGNVGGAADIVDHERTGWLIEPSVDNLRAALGATLAARDELPAIGARARLAAERKFDGTANDRRVIDLLLEVSKRRAHEAGRRAAIEER